MSTHFAVGRLMRVVCWGVVLWGTGCVPEQPKHHHDAVRRIVHLSLEASGDALQGNASFWPRSAVSQPSATPGCRQAEAPPHGVRASTGVVLDYGRRSVLEWDPNGGHYQETTEAEGRDLSWQPVAVRSSGPAGWRLDVAEGLQFGERPTAWLGSHLTGGTEVLWTGAYSPEQLVLHVDVGGVLLTCQAQQSRLVLPWWVDALGDVELSLSATRRSVHLTDDGTLLIGDATLTVPVDEQQVAPSLTERPGPPPARPIPRRWIRRGNNPLTRVTLPG